MHNYQSMPFNLMQYIIIVRRNLTYILKYILTYREHKSNSISILVIFSQRNFKLLQYKAKNARRYFSATHIANLEFLILNWLEKKNKFIIKLSPETILILSTVSLRCFTIILLLLCSQSSFLFFLSTPITIIFLSFPIQCLYLRII